MAVRARGMTPARLRLFLGALFVLLALPTLVLVIEAQRRLKWEAFAQQRTIADEFGLRVDVELQRRIAEEEARGYADYGFLVVGGDPAASNFLQLSPLSRYPVESSLPGAVGYFQVAADGTFSTPLLPADPTEAERWGISGEELAQRIALRDNLYAVLSRNHLAGATENRGQVALFDRAGSVYGGFSRKMQPDPGFAARSIGASGRSAGTPVCQRSASTPASPEKKDEPQPRDEQAGAKGYVAKQSAFDELNAAEGEAQRQEKTSNELGRVEDLKLDKALDARSADREKQEADAPAYEQRLRANVPPRASRKERAAVLEPDASKSYGADADASTQAFADAPASPRAVRTFESELDPFDFSLLDDRHGVFFRKVWRDGQRTIQGIVVERAAFLDGAVAQPFRETALADAASLVLAYRDDVLAVVRGRNGRGVSRASEVAGELLHQRALSAPLGDFRLIWNAEHLPPAPGAGVVTWSSLVLLAVLLAGLALAYRLGMREIVLARQQQDFVSAVSHELKTPLTSIRMYAEMLREGWAAPEKQREYYGFIHDESERLSRLIANVLQLARMERNELPLEPKRTSVAALVDLVRSKVHTQVERAGFTLALATDPACAQRELDVDPDAFAQIVINLVDNALKFAARAQRRGIDVAAAPSGAGAVVFSVRDYGPGVERTQMQKIFRLFYRPGSELTRETLGTGIGLALVRELARAMGGDADVVNREPGAEFRVTLPLAP